MTRELIGDCIYSNYRYNRNRTPEVAPEQWKKVYGTRVAVMEPEYQSEQKVKEIRDNIDRCTDRICETLEQFCPVDAMSYIRSQVHTELLTLVIQTRYDT